MKKALLLYFFLPVFSLVLLTSCGGDKKVDGKVITNEKFGYSVLVPDEFQHGKGGGVHTCSAGGSGTSSGDEAGESFSCDGYEFKIIAKVINNYDQPIKRSFEMYKSSANVIDAKMLDDESFVVIGKDASKLQAYIECQKKGNKYTITMGYPANEEKEFMDVVDAVVKSFEVK